MLVNGIEIDLGTTTGAPADLSTAANLIQTFRLIAQKLDEQDIPSEDRFAVLTPELYYLLAGSDNAAINRDFSGAGSIASGKVLELVGLKIFSSTHLSDIATNGAHLLVTTPTPRTTRSTTLTALRLPRAILTQVSTFLSSLLVTSPLSELSSLWTSLWNRNTPFLSKRPSCLPNTQWVMVSFVLKVL